MRFPGPKNPKNWQNLQRVAKLGLAPFRDPFPLRLTLTPTGSLLSDGAFCILCCMSLSERAAKAAKIAEEPDLYKVCEGCDSIVTKRVATCPSCHGYRFNEDPAVVIEQAKLLGSREQRSVVSEDLL